MPEVPDVRPGQVWADNDWRSEGRTVMVLEVDERDGKDPHAIVEVLTPAKGGLPIKKPRKTRIAVRRFVPNSTGYRLIQDHDHAERCCREHGIHSVPHKGCILR